MNFDRKYFEAVPQDQRYTMVLRLLEQLGDMLRPGAGQHMVHTMAPVAAACMLDVGNLTWRQEQSLAKLIEDSRKHSKTITDMIDVFFPPAGKFLFMVRLKDAIITVSGRN